MANGLTHTHIHLPSIYPPAAHPPRLPSVHSLPLPSIHPLIDSAICLSSHPPTHQSLISPSIYSPICLLIYSPFHLSTHPFIHLPTNVPTLHFVSIHPFTYQLSFSLLIHTSTYPSIHPLIIHPPTNSPIHLFASPSTCILSYKTSHSFSHLLTQPSIHQPTSAHSLTIYLLTHHPSIHLSTSHLIHHFHSSYTSIHTSLFIHSFTHSFIYLSFTCLPSIHPFIHHPSFYSLVSPLIHPPHIHL